MLETWEAKRLERVLSSGRTKPLVIECSHSTMEVEYNTRELETSLKVVKAFDLPEVSQFSLFSELLGNSLARLLDINTPEPCLVHISSPFAQAANLVLEREGLRLRPGLASGCQYFKGGYTSVNSLLLSPEELQEAAYIYAFDLLVQNPDRTKRHPNCAMFSQQLKAYDFETAFSFVLLIGQAYQAWEVSKHGIAPSHIFYGALRSRKKEVSWERFISRLKNITSHHIDDLITGFPPDWLEHAPQVRSHILSVVEHAREFEFELRRSLL